MAPQNPKTPPGQAVNPTAMVIDAMTALSQQLRENLDYLKKQDEKLKAVPPQTARAQQEAKLSAYERSLLQGEGQQLQFNFDRPYTGPSLINRVSSPETLGPPPSPTMPQEAWPQGWKDSQQGPTTFREKVSHLKQAKSDGQFRDALGQLSGRIPPPQNPVLGGDTASYPPGSTPSTPAGDVPPPGSRGSKPGTMDNTNMLSWAVLGEHGGPSFVRNLAFEQWGLQNSLNWAQNNAPRLAQSLPEGFSMLGLNQKNLTSISDMLSIAQDHPFYTYAGYKALKSIGGGLGALVNTGENWQNMGAQLGVGVTPDRYIFGHRNPFAPLLSASTSVGMGAAINRRQLEGQLPGGMGLGSGLSGQQATDVINQIVSQGFGANENKWGGGDIGMIAKEYMGPLMQQYPGLSAADLGQFLPMLKNSGTSLQQLTTTLSDLGQAAKATHETVGQAASSLQAYAEQTQGMGSAQGALNSASQFRSITGMDPQIQAQMLQNPTTQGLALSHGILPSALNDIGGAAGTAISTASLQMMMHMVGGLHGVHTNINGIPINISAKQEQLDQAAKMMGITPQQADRLLSQSQGNQAREKLMAGLGSPTSGFMGMTHDGKAHGTAAENAAAQVYWMKNVAPNWKGTGISEGEMHRLNNMGFQARIRQLQKYMDDAQSKSSWGTTQQNSSSQTVHVAFTGMAAKMFQQVGPTTAKQAANAGQLKTGINSVVNSISGETRGVGGFISDAFSGNWAGAASDVGQAIGNLL